MGYVECAVPEPVEGSLGQWVMWSMLRNSPVLRYTSITSIMLCQRRNSVYPKLYIGHIPPTPEARRVLRYYALELSERLRARSSTQAIYVLFNFSPSKQMEHEPVDLLLLQENTIIVGILQECKVPLDIFPNGQWQIRETGQQMVGLRGETPLEQIKQTRATIRQRIEDYAAAVPGITVGEQGLQRITGALICVPSIHPESRVTLDIADHRSQIKVLGLNELPALAMMTNSAVTMDEYTLQALVSDVFSGQCWHNGSQLLFELAPTSLRLRVLTAQSQTEQILPLIEETNVVGRRNTPLRHEYRLTLTGDDLMSNDHAIITCIPDGRVLLQDTSTNGTWITLPGQTEEHLHHVEREIVPDTFLRMGATNLRLETVPVHTQEDI